MSLGELFKTIKREYPELDTFCRVELAYAVLVLCHGGQYSQSYADLCKLGAIFKPAMGGYECSEEMIDNISNIYMGNNEVVS